MAAAAAAESEGVYKLAVNAELRIMASVPATITLLEGTAEIMGVEMLRDRPVVIPQAESRPVFTFHGAQLRVDPPTTTAYVSDDSTFPYLASINARLEALRAVARGTAGGLSGGPEMSKAAGGSRLGTQKGPVIVIAGPTDAGKSTATMTLAAWACRRSWAPTVVDLDPGQGELAPPTCVAAAPIDKAALADSGGIITHAAPVLAFPVGGTSPTASEALFRQSIENIARAVRARAEADTEGGGASGVIVNTCGWVDGHGYKLLKFAIQVLEADVVLVIGDDGLHAGLRRDLPELCPASASSASGAASSSVALVNMPSSGGSRRRGKTERADTRRDRIRMYFYGIPSHSSTEEDDGSADSKPAAPPSSAMPLVKLEPYSSYVSKADLRVLRIGGAETASHQLPVGHKSQLSALRVSMLAIDSSLSSQLLALSTAETAGEVASSPIHGFVVMNDVNPDDDVVSLMLPTAQTLPKPAFLVWTGVTFADE